MIEWLVYRFNINAQKIEKFNIFNHGGFLKYTHKTIKKYISKEDFEEQLKKELLFYFWGKAEHELVIEKYDGGISLIPWCGCLRPEEARIDVTCDVDFDWKGFSDIHIDRQIYGSKAKIDIYDQVMMNWEEFVEYCWNNKKQILKMK